MATKHDVKRALAPVALVVAGALFGLSAGLLLWHRPEPAGGPGKPTAVDIGFAQDMAVHHSQAIDMADLAIDRSRDPRIRLMARQILVSQSTERGTLQGWLVTWRAPQLPSGQPMQWMPHDTHLAHQASMPGMATGAQMRHLGELRGAAFDREFATLMTRHHEGGIAMAEAALKHAGIADVRSLAAMMITQQTQEIATLRSFR